MEAWRRRFKIITFWKTSFFKPMTSSLKKTTRKSVSRILYFRRSACYLSTYYIAAILELITPRLSGRAAPIFIAEKNRYTYHCTAKSLPGFTTAELYLLSVALVLPSRVTDVIRFAALWCPDFPTSCKQEINKPIFSQMQRYTNFVVKRQNGKMAKWC